MSVNKQTNASELTSVDKLVSFLGCEELEAALEHERLIIEGLREDRDHCKKACYFYLDKGHFTMARIELARAEKINLELNLKLLQSGRMPNTTDFMYGEQHYG